MNRRRIDKEYVSGPTDLGLSKQALPSDLTFQNETPSSLGQGESQVCLEGLGAVFSEPTASDEQLVQEYLSTKQPEAFEILVRRYEREIYTFLRRFLGDVQAAEDVFQATFLNVHLRLNQFEDGRKFRPWLYAIANNKAIDYMRRNRRHKIGSLNTPSVNSDKEETMLQRIAGQESQPDQVALRQETGERVRQAVQQLNEPTQELLNLAFYQGLKYADIADILQIPLGTVKSRVFTAIRKLNAIWMRMEENDAKQGKQAS